MMKSLKEQILELKKKKNVVILAHYYQEADIQDVADYVGDSLGLSQEAAKTDADIILFAGVHFMAETAKILNPTKKVILPDLKAGCLSDIVCTSSNAIKIVESVPKETPIIFAPDKNLGKYIISKTGRDMLLWDGSCVVHEAFSLDKLIAVYKEHPDAKIIAHPESETHILETATYIGSTSGMIDYVKTNPNHKFIVATEAGILHKMQQEVPHKILIPAPAKENNTCACSECGYMKMNTLQKLYNCLLHETPEVTVPENIRKRALVPIERMLELSK
jgi:quinolinate synthase